MAVQSNCYCGSGKSFSECCEPFIKGIQNAPTAEKLMRSRYSAYATQAADYLVATTHASKRKYHSKSDIQEWSKSNQWLKLEVLNVSENSVEFKAYFLDNRLKATMHHEKSAFKKEDGVWFYVDGEFY
jgi:SEC-C motif domain protein